MRKRPPSGLPKTAYRMGAMPMSGTSPKPGSGSKATAFVGVSATRIYLAGLAVAGGLQAELFELCAGLARSVGQALEEGFGGRSR